ncbi:hypothetical protein Tco_1473819 [Tanacetum coccineum]
MNDVLSWRCLAIAISLIPALFLQLLWFASRGLSLLLLVISFAAPVVETTLVASPTGLCGLIPYSDSDSDSPDEMTFMYYVARWRSRVTARPSSSSEFPIAPVTASPEIRRRLASRHVSPRSSDHHSSSSSSSSDSSPVHSSGLDASDQAHSGSSTRDVPPRLCYPPRRAPRRSEAFRRWCVAPLSTLYPPTTSESSSGDSSERPLHSSSHSAGPSRKRCRSPVDSIPSSTLVMGSLAPTRADLLPPRIDPRSVPVADEESEEPAGEDSSDSSGTRDGIVRSFEDIPIDLDDAVCDFYHHMYEVRIDRIVEIETDQRRLEADQLIARGERAGMVERIESLRLENLKVRAMLDIKRDPVNSLRLHMSLSQEEFRQVRRDRDDTQRRLRRLESYLERRFGFRP